MKKYDLMSSLTWMIIAALFCRGAIGLGLGDLHEPGPGFFPFLMSLFIILFSILILISSLKKGEESDPDLGKRFWPEREGQKKILLTVGSLFLYVFALEYLGFILCTFLLIFFQLKFVEPQKWATVLFGTGLTTFMTYTIFDLWLRVPMPVGLLGF